MNVVVIGSRARRERKHTVATKTKQRMLRNAGRHWLRQHFRTYQARRYKKKG